MSIICITACRSSRDTAEKYEGGGLPFALLYAMEQAIELMLETGPEAIERRVMQLADSTRDRLREMGASVNTGSQIVAAKFPDRIHRIWRAS